jgi:L-amino acid N-acyltransferase YncA
MGVGSLLLDSLIYLAHKENLHWIKAEVVTELKSVTKAFESRGFKIKAFLEDYFTDLQGRMYDVALMMRPLLEEKVDF